MNKAAKAVLVELDDIARGVCRYEYGLPLYSDESEARMAAVVEEAIAAAVAAERERCAKIAETATTGLTGFAESDRMEFAVANMAKLRDAIAARIRSGEAAHSHDRLPPGQEVKEGGEG